jgi:hypothetical protein
MSDMQAYILVGLFTFVIGGLIYAIIFLANSDEIKRRN